MSYTTNEVYGRLRDIMHDIRTSAPVIPFPRDHAASSDIRIGYLDGNPVRRLVITLRGPGCDWVQRGGGCFMCGHHAGTTRGAIPTPEEYLSQFRAEIARYPMNDIAILSLYNSGSVLNPAEVPPEALRSIFREIRSHHEIGKVVLETRAEFVTPEYLDELRTQLGQNCILTVAMGLETADDGLRSLCINKGCSLSEIARAASIARDFGTVQLYTLLGLPFLTESEAVEDSIRSIRCADRLGADEVHIEPLTLQRYTLIERLYRAGLYRLPSLYSIYAVLREVLPEIRPYVSPFLHMPLPDRIPEGCADCTPRLLEGLLDRYNRFRDAASLQEPPCSCLKEWDERMRFTETRPLPARINDALDKLEQEGAS